MLNIAIPDPVGNLYLVTDSHLDYDSAPYSEFIDFLDSLIPFDDCFFDLIDLIGLIAWSGLIDLFDSSKVGQILFDWLDVLG